MKTQLFTNIPLPIFAEENGDAINPGLRAPTDIYEVARLTRPQREERLENLTKQAYDIYQLSLEALDGREHMGSLISWSGGNDSNVLAHLMRPVATHAYMANTGIGIEETRQFVRDQAAAWNLPLIEKTASKKDSYELFVTTHGFPGPAQHDRMYQRLKQRQQRKARAELVTNGIRQRVIFIGGRRRQESRKRMSLGFLDRDGSIINVSPIINWTHLDMTTYRLIHDDVPINGMSVKLGMSGECLCGANAKPGELDRVREHAPAVAMQIDSLASKARENGVAAPFDQWGHGQGKPIENPKCGDGCGIANTDPLWQLLDPLAKDDPLNWAIDSGKDAA